MIDIKNLEDNLHLWKQGFIKRNLDLNLEDIVSARKNCLELMAKVESLRAQKNKAAKKQDKDVGARIKKELDKLEKNLAAAYKKVEKLAAQIPNLPFPDVPSGGEENNLVLETVGKLPQVVEPKNHIALGKALDIIDIDRGVKTSGSRFYFLKNQAVELEFALVKWVMDLLKNKGFELMVPPQLVNKTVMKAGGYLGKNENEIYKVQDDLYLIGTSEQSILGYHLGEIIDLPKHYAAFSTCFRREAGSYGKDVKGIIRTHQFDKVEMFSFVKPEESEKELEILVKIEEEILQKLEIPYQKVLLAAGDLSIPSAKTIDLESWLPSQKRYRETHSASNCTDWQARRANIRYKKGEYVNTLNGTAIAVGRILVVLMENHQQPDGSIKIPKVLHPYLSFKEIK